MPCNFRVYGWGFSGTSGGVWTAQYGPARAQEQDKTAQNIEQLGKQRAQAYVESIKGYAEQYCPDSTLADKGAAGIASFLKNSEGAWKEVVRAAGFTKKGTIRGELQRSRMAPRMQNGRWTGCHGVKTTATSATFTVFKHPSGATVYATEGLTGNLFLVRPTDPGPSFAPTLHERV